MYVSECEFGKYPYMLNEDIILEKLQFSPPNYQLFYK
jgi:hypothetical protein